ncbi:MAG: hypothetical protein N838_31000 [Thiohalocapsa sp. PB-PSB1]|nr:MAG: hypothetical protein N838_31000 [Thiohalocapsa sp. PB-PSB1]HCS90777.1 hypothetical protein [Chromatiaceae bacterium]
MLLDYALTYSAVGTAAIAASGDDAYAEAFVDLFVDGVVLQGIGSVSDIAIADITGTDRVADMTSFSIELPAGQSAEILLTIGAFGTATGAAVPVPSALLLMLPGLAVLRLQAVRRPAA